MAARSKAPKKANRKTTSKPDHKAKFTANHRVIRKWAEERGGKPATVKGTRRQGDPAGLLRIDFPGYSGAQSLKEISWDDFFAKFDESNLAMLYQNQTADGQPSRFCKFVSMETAEASGASEDRAREGAGPKGGGQEGGAATAADRPRKAGHKARTTTSHRVIRKWVEERGGKPATVKGTRRQGDPAGLLRIDFPGYSGAQSLKEISWDDFFAKFDEGRLVFLHQDTTADGQPSRFCKFISMESAEEKA